ncbi:MAG: hypothetical protein U0694_11660 [Anaerolineae bacterium]
MLGCVAVLLTLLAGSVHAQAVPTATTRAEVSVYTAPEFLSGTIETIPAGSVVNILGRNEFAQWILVQDSADAVSQGWVPAGSMILNESTSLWELPTIQAEVEDPLSPDFSTLPAADSSDIAEYQRLLAAPLLDNMDTEQVRAIFAHGQDLGMRADVFTRVGDSNTTSGGFLNPIGMRGNFCDFGAYSYLQDTVSFFSVSPQEGEPNSFDSFSVAAVNGLSTAAALDPFWADTQVCRSNESPLACEYRLVHPSVAVIMLGLMDVEYFEADESRDYMRDIMDFSIEQGVIPVWTTFPVLADNEPDHPSWERSLYFNAAILDIVEEYQTPLINLWAAVQPLPNDGIGPDRIHLAQSLGEFCAFTGAEQRVGGTLRNLLTLQALDLLRRNVLAAAP